MKQMILISCAAVILSGCAMSERMCTESDWYRVGVSDGKQGRSAERFSAINRQCQRHDITPSQTLWEKGRQVGLKSYCTPENAFELGLDGRSIRATCPPELRAELKRANERGLEIYKVKSELEELRDEISELRELLERTEPDTPEYEATKTKIRRLDFDLWRMENRLDRLLRKYGG